MADFMTGLRDISIRSGGNTGAVPNIGGMAQQASMSGAPTAGALAAATPNPPMPDLGSLPGMTPEMMANPATAALVGTLFGGAGAGMGAPAPPSAPDPMGMAAMGEMIAPMTEDSGVGAYTSPPQIGLYEIDEDYPQTFRAKNGRYPTKRDYAEREWSIDFTNRMGRYPTKLEFVLQFTPPGVSDGAPEWSVAA